MNKIDEFLFKISGYKPDIKDGQFIVSDSLISKADEAYNQKNYEIAVRIWEKFANLNSGICLVKLAGAYWEGNGVQLDYKKSFNLLIKGTLLIGGTQNYFNLAVGYQLGGFTDKNLYHSFFFYTCAEHYAREDEVDLKNQSKERKEEIYKELSNDDRNKADSLVKAVSMGFEPAGMSVAVDLLETL
jgi:hypothetical protein